MKDLTTRRIVLGMLMWLVLALSVASLAEALTFRDHSRGDGDLQTVLPNQQGGFKIRFSITPGSNNTRIYDSAGELITQAWTAADGAPAGISGVGTADVYYIDTSGYVLSGVDGDRVNSTGTSVDSSGYQLDANGNRLNATGDPPTVGSSPIDSSGFLLNANGTRVRVNAGSTTHDPAGRFYRLVDTTGSVETVDSSKYRISANGLRVNEAG